RPPPNGPRGGPRAVPGAALARRCWPAKWRAFSPSGQCGSEQRALAAAARGPALGRARTARRGAPLAPSPGAAGERLRPDAAVGELDVDELASGNLSGGAHGAAGAVAHERVAALQYAL